MIRIKLMDGGTLEIPREEALELLPYRGVFESPVLKNPIQGLLTHRGKLVPVLGPLPESKSLSLPAEERPWLLLMKGCAQVIHGLPEFDEHAARLSEVKSDEQQNEGLLKELDELLKAA